MSNLFNFRKTLNFMQRLTPNQRIREQALQLASIGHLDLLRSWQANRLERTYTDLLDSQRFAPACRFFLDDIYAPKDFRRRDHEIKHLYEIMSSFLPDFLLRLVKKTVELNDLTNQLDEKLLDTLIHDLGVTDTITPEHYAEGYRICDNYAERAYQIELIGQVGSMVDISMKIPLVGTSLKLARIPAQRAGWNDLHEFIERGFHAFKHMHGAREFLDTIHERETGILDRIFANDPLPFKPYL